MTQLDLYIGFNIAKFETEATKVTWASTYLRGPAFDWFEPFLRDYINNVEAEREAETKDMFSSFSKFKLRITRIFGDIDEERTSERHIRALNQKGPASSYAAEFQQYANRTQWDNAALIAQFY